MDNNKTVTYMYFTSISIEIKVLFAVVTTVLKQSIFF